ncbi:uncharacterized protein LOC107478820 isoform X1 [Arachis duranensis]|uniref:Uncharacterized protein n=3 Tax=Arachis TaxID=3817 RepID=A0A445DX32_ARAHY|nr:uncharacterized protein LOC107478820 isoform X1 [Arachis duranensis]XP_025688467.1 uncharacterized protein LOC112790340 isoform X1 [Arachis hypogaea]QHO57289.1 uncharacterized protein DS421_3g80990 [Arachis hypogaea]RYR67736.1 hypothetical protein Ahy_A03g014127 [Arachis hypogaea]
MPGTIMVSVLEFMDLPLSSSTSIRVSMGKIEYQISDKGNYSFPLTSLRDDLIVKILEADGNEIARTGIHVRLILEKGVWEDMFTLGEGHLHLKLQFILSDEERDRIRIMRQSALKKKHDELLSSRQRGAETDSSTVIGNDALPFHTNDERLFPDVLSAPSSEESKNHLQHKAVSRLHGPVVLFNKESDTRGIAGGVQLDKKKLKPNSADQYKSTKPVLQVANLAQSPHKGKKPMNQSSPEGQYQEILSSEEMANRLRRSEQNDSMTNNPIQPMMEEDSPQYFEVKRAMRRTPSNVRKMISAFESGMAQDMRPYIKPPPTKYQSSKIERKDSSKTRYLEQDKSQDAEPAAILQENVNKRTDSNARNKLDKYYPFESSGAWIFPDESRKMCITTSGKSLNGVEESQDKKCLSHQRSLHLSQLENKGKNAEHFRTGTKGSKHERIKESRGSTTRGSSADNADENSGGPVNQVIKVAIIVGFGILVLLTRQRKKRCEN